MRQSDVVCVIWSCQCVCMLIDVPRYVIGLITTLVIMIKFKHGQVR